MMMLMLMQILIITFFLCSIVLLVESLSPHEEINVQKKNDAIKQGQSLKYDFLDDYHFPMVADEVRNSMFHSALQKAIVPNQSKVLDVGAGSMLLSMMATDLGASKVVGVEANPLMCEVAREVLRLNGYTNDSTTGNIRLYEGRFETLYPGDKQMGKPADIFVSETFDSGLIGENFLSILSHAKTNHLIKKTAIIIPNSATMFVQLLESTFSLPPGRPQGDRSEAKSEAEVRESERESERESVIMGEEHGIAPPYRVAGKYNLEPMRRHRPAGVFTVRYLDEQNAVRQHLSAVTPLFEFDFQNFDPVSGHFGYSCLLIEVTQEEGLLDSIGLWFHLYMDKERSLVMSNAPNTATVRASSASSTLPTCAESPQAGETCISEQPAAEETTTANTASSTTATATAPQRAPCWMQALYRLSSDLHVRRGDLLRLQVVHLSNSFVFSQVGNGLHNSHSRLVKFIAVNCVNDVQVFAYSNDKFEEKQEASLSPEDLGSEYLLGKIVAKSQQQQQQPASRKKRNKKSTSFESFTVFPVRVFQMFKFAIHLESGKQLGMLYQLPDSTADMSGTGTESSSEEDRARRKLSLDEYRITCPQ